tara:strand:+ start:1740 stop:5120 length:3381 start_codon:yes stop_codon:yes gene_type:complete
MQFQEFVSKIKNKYPQYKDMDDAELGSRVLNKYPEYLNSIDQSSIPSPYAANEILNRGLGYDLDERKRKLMDAALNPLDQEKYKAKLYYDKKFGIDHTPTLLEQQVKLEYGRNATLQSANNLNKKASTYQFEKYNKFTQAFLINWERLKVAAKSLPEQFLVQLNQSNIGTSPMGIPNTNFIEYQKAISQNVEAVENMPSMQLLRKSAQQDAEKRDVYIQKFRNPKAQSLAKSWNEGNFKQLGSDLFDLALLELPNFINIISASLVNPALGLAYVGTTSSGSRYQEGITNGESPKEAAGKANLHALAEVVFEKLGTIGLIESTIRRTAKREFTRSFVQKAVDFSREPSTEVATQITQNLVDGKNWNEGIVEAAAIGAIYGAGVNTAITLGDATRVRFQNTNQQIDEIIESDPILSETPERAELARNAFKEPSDETLTELNNDIFKEKVIAEPTPVAEPTEPQELKSIEQMRREIDVTEDSFVDIQNNLEEDVNPVTDELNKSRSKFVNNIMTPLLSAVEDINPQVGARLRKFEFDVHRKKRDDSLEILDFVKEMNQLAKKDSYKFTQVSDMLLNGKYKKASENISNKNLKKVRNLMEKYADELETVGFDVSRQTDYFPRRVKDYEGLKDELGQEIAGKIDDALAEQQEKATKKGYVLSTIEESKIINNVITGAYRPVGGVKPRALKERKIEEITSDISPYYYDAIESLIMYLDEAADVIEMRKLFGKDLQLDGDVVDINESIGAYINEISKGLDPKDQSDLISLFRTRFSYRPTGKLLQKYKTLVNLTTLGQIQNAVTQMGDMTWAVYENGFANTLKAAFGNKKITTKDLGIKEIAAEFRSFDGLKKVLDKLFELSGFKKIDQLGKETLVNSTLLEYQQQAKDGKFDRKKQERLNVLFPTKEKQQEVIQQLKDKKSTEDIDFLMFSTLLDYQPVTLSNMPVKYLEMPNGRVLYTLKTFTIKQLDTYRQNGVDNIQLGIKSGDKELIKRGFSDLLRLVGIFYLMNVPTDLLKDLMSNKKIYLSDTLIDNFYKLLGVSRYNIEYATRGGKKPSEVLVRTVVPPFSFIDVPASDLVSIISNLKKGEETDISKLESWRFLPFIGRTLYYSVGKGKEKEEKKAKQKEKENKS